MFRRTVLLSGVLFSGLVTALSPSTSFAAVHIGGAASPEAMRTSGEIRLAQASDVEIYYDNRGRRVIVDAWTGEVLAIQPPRQVQEERAIRRAERFRERQEGGPYYRDDPEDMARLRRDMERELGIYAEPRQEYEAVPEEEWAIEEPDDYTLRDRRETPRREASREPFVAPPLDNGNVKRVERNPLAPAEQGSASTAATGQGSTGQGSGAPGEIIVEEPIGPAVTFDARPEVAELQILLDRVGASPGVIDGRFGSNVDKALIAYRDLTGENLKSTDAVGIKAALMSRGGEAFTTYTITPEDAAGPYVASVPADYGEKAKLEHLSYTSVTEALAEKFHMDEKYLKALNPEANFNRPGTTITVAKTGANVQAPVARIVADKGKKQVRAYDDGGKLVAAYPATIGSSDTPSPTGTHTVDRIAVDPEYTYNPNLNFKQGDNHKVLTIPPGPNGPVGSVWIALSKPTYGIHGTPDPSKIGKTESHGCVRLTNWDAQELAKVVKKGVTVEFIE